MIAMRLLRQVAPLAGACVLAAAALRPPAWSRDSRGMLAFLLDTSTSMPARERSAAIERLAEALDEVPPETPIGVMTFDESPRLVGVSRADRAADLLRTAAAQAPADRVTDTGSAIGAGAGLLAAAGGGDLILVSDGADVVGEADSRARAASRNGVNLHVMPLPGSPEGEVAIESLEVAASAGDRTVVEATAIVRSTSGQTVNVVAEADSVAAASASVELAAGAATAVTLLFAMPRSGNLSVFVDAAGDVDPSNNIARAVVAASRGSRTAFLGMDPPPGSGSERWDRLPHPEALSGFDALVVRADRRLAAAAGEQENIASFARSGRAVLVATGDPLAAAQMRGGPLESILPVSLEPARQDGDRSSIVLLLDRSGSMGEPSEDAAPLSLALEAAKSLGSLLPEDDRFGVIAFDVAPHVIRAPGPGGDVSFEGAGDGIVKAAGGTDWRSSLEMALVWLSADRAPRRHVILVSDGRLAPGVSGEPAVDWPAEITLSTVSMGKDADQEPLARLSSRFGGRHDHVDRAEDLPAALRRESAHFRLPQRRDGVFAAAPAPAYASVLPTVLAREGSLLLDPREGAEVAMTTPDGKPFLVFGKAGWGRVAFLASDPAGSGGTEGADGTSRLLSAALARLSAASGSGPDRMAVSASRGRASLEVLSSSGPIPRARALTPSGREIELRLKAAVPGRLRADFFTTEPGEYAVDVDGTLRRFFVSTTAERASLPQDPDWAARLAKAGGGTLLASQGPVLPAPRTVPRSADPAPPLIAAAALIVFADALLGLRRRRASPIGHTEGM